MPNQETNSEAGMLFAVGGEIRIGPGSVAAEIDIVYAGLNHQVTGNVADGGISLQVGYHVLW